MSKEPLAGKTSHKKSTVNRFWATVAAQTAGVLLLFFIAIIFDLWNEPCSANLEAGIHQIFVVAFLVFIGLVVGCATSFIPTQDCPLGEMHVSRTLFIFLCFDIPLLSCLVILEGGFSRSVFTPLFFLIYIAYNAVEQEERTFRKLAILGTLQIFMLVTWLAPYYQPPNSRILGFEFLTVTDFSVIDERRFSFTNFLVASLSLAIYVVQLRIIKLPQGDAEADGKGTGGSTKAVEAEAQDVQTGQPEQVAAAADGNGTGVVEGNERVRRESGEAPLPVSPPSEGK